MSSLMLIITYVVFPLISALLMYAILMKRTQNYRKLLLRQWKQQEEQQHSKKVKQLTQKRERKLEKMKQRSSYHQERDESKLDDLTEDDERLTF